MALDKFIKKFINGDTSAFDDIYNLTQKSVYYVALSILRDKALAEDVMQTTYMRMLKNKRCRMDIYDCKKRSAKYKKSPYAGTKR